MRFNTAISLMSLSLFAAQSNADPLNDIDDLCHANFGTDTKAIICQRSDQSGQWTTYFGNTGVTMCCSVGSSCMLTNETSPEVACYNPTTKKASTHSDVNPCNGTATSCTTMSGHIVLTDKGVTQYTAVKDGKGVKASGSGSSTPNAATRYEGIQISTFATVGAGLFLFGFLL